MSDNVSLGNVASVTGKGRYFNALQAFAAHILPEAPWLCRGREGLGKP